MRCRSVRLWYGEPNASDFVIKKITAPHTDGMKGGFSSRTSPPTSLVIEARPLRLRRIFL
jgi:hypothetical protein